MGNDISPEIVDPAPEDTEAVLGNDVSLNAILQLIEQGRANNIIVMVGAGLSVSAGIPDFRTPGTGLYGEPLLRHRLLLHEQPIRHSEPLCLDLISRPQYRSALSVWVSVSVNILALVLCSHRLTDEALLRRQPAEVRPPGAAGHIRCVWRSSAHQ